jgi:hypothetical protein
MRDEAILQHISALVDEEQRVRGQGSTTPTEQERLHAIGDQLDRCWDLLRQRRAKREFGEDPSTAHLRDTDTVRRYEG